MKLTLASLVRFACAVLASLSHAILYTDHRCERAVEPVLASIRYATGDRCVQSTCLVMVARTFEVEEERVSAESDVNSTVRTCRKKPPENPRTPDSSQKPTAMHKDSTRKNSPSFPYLSSSAPAENVDTVGLSAAPLAMKRSTVYCKWILVGLGQASKIRVGVEHVRIGEAWWRHYAKDGSSLFMPCSWDGDA